MIQNSMEMAELENASPHDAKKWLISLRYVHDISHYIGLHIKSFPQNTSSKILNNISNKYHYC
ncbi:hypothetical protein Fmac_025296 [Flemingia macrophylla]|uniref:PH domain-containing protein n=1 Tax=Flemingia macrophylla TaxID=520843 RepID=A0ABD1LSE8_9FABA